MKPRIRISDLEEWFDNPEETLNDFMNSGQAIFNITFPGGKRPIELNQREVGALLIEINNKKVWMCAYCRTNNSGKYNECVACGAMRL